MILNVVCLFVAVVTAIYAAGHPRLGLRWVLLFIALAIINVLVVVY